MHERPLIYVAGPLFSWGDPAQHVETAKRAGLELIRLGYAPIVPHLSYYYDPTGQTYDHATWISVDLPLLRVAQAVLLLPGWATSKGARIEEAEARRVGIPCFTSLIALHQHFQERYGLAPDPEQSLPAPIAPKHPGTLSQYQLAQLMEETFARLRRVRAAGQQEYAHDPSDAFANFHELAAQLGIDRKLVAWTYAAKHIRGIVAYLNGHESQREDIEGRIDDLEQYLELIRGMIRCDKQAAALAEPPPAEPAASENGGLLRRFFKRD